MMKTRKPQAALSLTATLTIAFLAFGVLVLLISGGLQLFSNLQTQQTIISSNQQLVAQEAARIVSSFIQEKFSALETAIWIAEPATASPAEQKLMLDSLLGLQPAFFKLVLLNAQDQALAQATRLPLEAPWRPGDQLNGNVLAKIHQKERYISPVYIDPITSEPMVIMAVPVTDALRDFKGSLAIEVNLKFMWDLVDQLKVRETGYAYVVDRQGNLIAFGDTARVLKGENVGHLKAVSEFIHSPASAPAAGVSTYPGIMGVMVVGTYVPLGTPDWAVVTELPWQEAYREVIRQAVVSIGITLVMAVLAGMMGVSLARWLAVPMVHLKETATQIAEGERELQAAVKGPKEVASLAMAFNSMTAQLRQSLERLEQQVVEVKRAEESLRRTNETLQALIDYSPLAIIMLDLDSHVLLWNSAAEKMYGWTAQEALGKSLPFVLEDQLEEQRATKERVTQGEVFTNLELEHRRKDGSRISNSVSIAPLRDSTGSVYALMSVATDMTERKKAEEELRESEERFRSLVETTSDWVWETDQNGVYTYASPRVTDLLGYEPEEIRGKTPLDLMPPDVAEHISTIFRDIVASQRPFARLENTARHKEGQLVVLETSGVPFFDATGRLLGYRGIDRDITERKRAEEALQESEQRFRTLAEASFEGIALTEKGVFVDLNDQLAQMLGYAQSELVGKPVMEVVAPESRDLVAEAIRSGRLEPYEHLALRKDGTTFPVEARARVTQMVGRQLRITAIRDITERKRAEQALRESEERYRSLFENSPISLWEEDFSLVKGYFDELRVMDVTDLRAFFENHPEEVTHCTGLVKVLDVNKATVALVGARDKDELLAWLSNVLADEALGVFREELITLAEGGQWFESESVHRTLSGEERSIALNLSVAPGYANSLGKVLVSVLDITERKQAEAQLERNLRETRVRYEVSQALAGAETEDEVLDVLIQHASLYPQAFVAIMTFDSRGGERTAIVRRQDTFESGLTATAPIGGRLPPSIYTISRHHSADKPFVSEDVFADARVDPATREIFRQTGAGSLTFVPLMAENEWMGFIGAMAKHTSYFDEEKQSLYQTLAEQGAAALHAARLRAAVRESQQRFQGLVETLSDWIWEVDQNGVYTYVSPKIQDLLGYTPQEVLGKTPFDLMPPEEARRVADVFRPLVAARQPLVGLENTNRHKDGHLVVFEMSGVAFYDAEGQFKGYRGTDRDITERKRAEEEIRKLNEELEQRVIERTAQLEAANKELEAFSYSVSHDLRAPLRAMDGFSRILLEDYAPQLPSEVGRHLKTIRESSQQMGRLIDDLLAFSRLSRQALNKQDIMTGDVVRQVLADLRAEQEGRQVEIVVGELPMCQGDPMLLRQVWVNLLSNALKFTRKCEVARIEIGRQEQDGETVYFVRDNGTGFDMQYADKLFGVFQRLHSEREFEGTGVGLAIVQRIIHRHGGRVWAEGKVEDGATFYFTLPQKGA